MEQLAKLTVDTVGQQLYDTLQEHQKAIEVMEHEEMHYIIRHMQLCKMFDKGLNKLCVGFAPGTDSGIVRSVAKALLITGAQHKLGGAPPWLYSA